MGERIIFSPCNSVFFTAVLCTMKIALEAPTHPTPTHTAHCGKLVNKKKAWPCGVALQIGSGAITWFSKAFQPYSSGDLYPNTTKKAAGLGLVSGQDPGHPRLRESEVLLENPLHPTLQLGKLGQNAGYYLSQTTESISVRSREAEMEKKMG